MGEGTLVGVGVSHHSAPVEVRERLAMDEAGVRQELTWLREAGIAREAMIVSTCNRVELYAVVDDEARLRDDLLGRRGLGPLARHLVWRREQDAVRHLFRVASALDSLVVGEPQILGQVKESVRVAEEAHALGAVLHRLTQRTLWVAKHVRTHTDIGRHNVGVGNAGVALAQQIFSSLRGRRAMLVGTGEMGRQVAAAMVGAGLEELVVCNRTFARAVELAEEFRGTPIAFDRMPEYLDRVDIVITATAATTPILGPDAVRGALRARRWRPLFLVDLSVPRNVAPEVGEIDQAYLFNVDDLTQVVERGQKLREAASAEAEQIVAAEAERFARRLATLAAHDEIGRITRKAEALRQAELARSRWLDRLREDEREAVDVMTRALVKKILHGPLMRMREAVERGDDAAVEVLVQALGEASGAGE